jgi:hypothetical protein
LQELFSAFRERLTILEQIALTTWPDDLAEELAHTLLVATVMEATDIAPSDLSAHVSASAGKDSSAEDAGTEDAPSGQEGEEVIH